MLKASRKLKESHNMLRKECGNLVCALNENPDAFDGLEYDPPKRQLNPELYALGLPADKGFIHSHDASQQLAIVHHGLAYPVHHRPDRS